MNKKTKKILIIALSVMLVGLIGAMGAIFGKDDLNKAKDKFNELTEQEVVVETKNLVYNADFQINTTGIDIYNETNATKYQDPIFDGWNMTTTVDTENPQAFILRETDDGLYVNTEGQVAIYQAILDDEKIIGKTVTFSFSVNDVVYSKTFKIDEPETEYKVVAGSTLVVNYIRYRLENGTYQSKVVCGFHSGFEGVLNWVQIEQGDVFTGFGQGPATYEVA